MSQTVRRDPFARETLIKSRIYEPHHGCGECGRILHSHPTGRPYLYQFSVETDGGTIHPDPKLFCSVGCRSIYYS